MKKKFFEACKGSISIFLSILLTGVCSLTALVMEGGRYKTADQVLDEATVSSALSLLAGYDSTLQKRFGLYAVKSKDQSGGGILASAAKSSDLEKYMKINSDSSIGGLSMMYNLTSSTPAWKYDLANYSVLERQILEYEKYRAPVEILEDIVDIDKVIKDLKKDILKLIPGLQNILNIVEEVCKIFDALKNIYGLYKVIQQLETSILKGKGGFSNKVNDAITQGWSGFEKLVGGEDWPLADPSYHNAYTDLKNAIDEKVKYLNDHSPAPQKPEGECPSVDESNKETADELSAYSFILEHAVNNGYFDENGLVNGSESAADLYAAGVASVLYRSELTFITGSMTREECIKELSRKLRSYSGSYSLYDEANARFVTKDSADSVYSAVDSEAASCRKTYASQVGAQDRWNEQNKNYNDYQDNVSGYNSSIIEKRDKLTTSLESISSLFATYKSSFNSCVSAISSAISAVDKIDEEAANFQNEVNKAKKEKQNKNKEEGEKETIPDQNWKRETSDALETLKDLLKKDVLDKADEGSVFIANQKRALSGLTAEDIDSNFGSLESKQNLDKGKMEDENGYYLSKTAMTGKMAEIQAVEVIQKGSELLTVIDCFVELKEVFLKIPAFYDLRMVVELSSETTSLFPSKTGTDREESSLEDAAEVSSYLNEARSLLSSFYSDDIGLVDPENTSDTELLNEELIAAVGRIAENMQKVSGMQMSLKEQFLLIPVIINIIDSADAIRQMYNDMIFVMQHFKDFLELLPAQLGESVLINNYAVTRFSNRLGIVSGTSGIGQSFTGAKEKVANAQTFSQANVEYILNGSSHEKSNQQAVYFMIFILRLINNAVLILTNPDWMNIIAASSIASPIVFCAILYYESTVDMNILVRLGQKVPFIKTRMVLSKETLKAVVSDIKNIPEKDLKDSDMIDVVNFDEDFRVVADKNKSSLNKYYATKEVSEQTKAIIDNLEEGLCKIDYKTYMFMFMLFIPNRLKVQRMADLIQMELRYEQQYKKSVPATVLLRDYHTFVRVETHATLNSVLPVISLGKDGINKAGWKLDAVKYVGY